MQMWNDIVHASMLGTDKKMPDITGMPAGIREATALIYANEITDREEKFLQSAAVICNYKNCGVLPVKKEQVTLSMALPETKPYCSNASMQALKDILSEESTPLLLLWLQHCNQYGKIIQPEMLPAVLHAGAENKKLQPFIPGCTGNRGEWLSEFNEAWRFSQQQNPHEIWLTGTPEQRRVVLAEVRNRDAATAREWLQQTWAQEDAAARVSFLEILEQNISDADIPFLESLSADKSKKVKDQAAALLKQIAASPVVLSYRQVLTEAVVIKKEKALLGLSSKTSLYFRLPASIDDNIFKSGIEKLSNTSEFSDELFIIFQLIQSVPPGFWETQFGYTPEQIINLFQKDAVGRRMIPALITAVTKFKDSRWAFSMMQHSDTFYLDIIPMLPLQQQEYYSIAFFDKHADVIIQYAVQRKEEWGYELAKKILQHTAKNIYQYPRSFYNQHIHLIPFKMITEMDKFTPAQEYMKAAWNNTSEYISKLLQLKSQTIQSFTT